MLDRFSHLGFVFFEDVNVDIRGDFGIAMTEVLGNNKKPCRGRAYHINWKSERTTAEAVVLSEIERSETSIISWRSVGNLGTVGNSGGFTAIMGVFRG